MTLGETIRSFRKRKGIAQLYLAAGAGVSQGYLSRIEAGKATPSAGIVVRIAKTIRADPKELLRAAGYQRTSLQPATKLGRQRLPPSPERDAAIREASRRGMSYAEIGRRAGLTRARIRQVCLSL